MAGLVMMLVLQCYMHISQIQGEDLPFLSLSDVPHLIFTGYDDHAYHLPLPCDIPLGTNETSNEAWISTNGLVSFSGYYDDYSPSVFPIPYTIIAPYWDDIDMSDRGLGLYTVLTEHDTLPEVDSFLATRLNAPFTSTMLIVVQWMDVCPYINSFCFTNETNSFQVVIATDTLATYAIFTYKCGLLNWIDYRASIGFSISPTFYHNHPLSNSSNVNDIACLNETTSGWSNVIYKVTEGTPLGTSCAFKINPWYGSVLGGTSVIVSGTYFKLTDKVQCAFDGKLVTAVYLSNSSVLCVSPRLSKVGSITLELYKNDQLHASTAKFYSLSNEEDNRVNIMKNEVYFRSSDTIDLKWNPNNFISSADTGIVADDFLIDIKLFEERNDEETSETSVTELAVLATDLDNTGEMQVTIPFSDGVDQIDLERIITTGTIFIEAKLKTLDTELSNKIGYWSTTVVVFIKPSTSTGDDILWQKCQKWAEEQPPSIGQTLLDRVSNTPCPPNENQARVINSGLIEDSFIEGLAASFFHPEADRCYRQRTITSVNRGSGNQCCYKNGALLVGPSSGGSVDKVAPGINKIDHFWEDVMPYIYCCKGDEDIQKTRCDLYYEHRPSDDGSNFQPPIPACIYGDPHVVTLDLHKYTFNGKGEFILVQTPNDYLTIQGRMEEIQDINGNNAGATVFTAIAAKQSDSQTVQFQLEYHGTDTYLVVLVDGTKLNFEIIQSQDFGNVTVSKLENNTLEASFSSGALIRVQEQNDIISLLLVSLPETFKNQTSGLMGSYNGDQTDDLMPRSGDVPISIESSLQTIHEDFGIFWIVQNADKSLFSYPFGKDWSSYYFPEFVPIYEPTFSDSNLETLANSICQGDPFCLYDIATTQNTAIGQTTQQGGQDLEALIELSQPVSCDPSCVHGVCVDTNVCVCGEGYEGTICNTTVYSECDVNPCNNSGVCQYHAGTYMCTCSPEYSGPFCDIVLPKPTSSTLIMSSSSSTTRTTVSSTVRTSTTATTTDRPTTVTNPDRQQQTGLSTGGIIGIVAGIAGAIVLVVLGLMLAGVIVFRKHRKMEVVGAKYYGESTDDHMVNLYNKDELAYNVE